MLNGHILYDGMNSTNVSGTSSKSVPLYCLCSVSPLALRVIYSTRILIHSTFTWLIFNQYHGNHKGYDIWEFFRRLIKELLPNWRHIQKSVIIDRQANNYANHTYIYIFDIKYRALITKLYRNELIDVTPVMRTSNFPKPIDQIGTSDQVLFFCHYIQCLRVKKITCSKTTYKHANIGNIDIQTE